MNRSRPTRSRITCALAILLLGLVVHGLQAGALGLYWDDSGQLLQGLQTLQQHPLTFVLTDTAGSLPSERPFAFVAFALTRLAFLHGVPAVHWLLVALLIINAMALAAVARRLVDREWFAFAAAAIFLTYPLAPLQPLWPATVHYQVGCLLALASILCLDRAQASAPASPGRWMVAGGLAYAGALTTHEGLALVPPAYFVARWLFVTAPERRLVTARLLLLAGLLGAAALWRVALLPRYGRQMYGLSSDRMAPAAFALKAGQAVVKASYPWTSVRKHIRRSPGAARWRTAAVVAAAIGGVACLALAGAAGPNPPGAWVVALGAAGMMLTGAAAAISVSPVPIEYALGLSYGSRGNFVMLPGLAIGLPALLGALRLPSLVRSAALVVLVFWGSLLHFTVKQEFVDEWRAHQARLTTLGTLAPALADSTLVIIFDERDRRAPYADHYEMSCWLLALYGNWSLLANTTHHLRFYPNGVESTYHGAPGRWFAPGTRGVLATAALQPVGRIGYDRVVLFRNDRGRLRAVADTVVTAEDGGTVHVRSNTARIRPGSPPSTLVWRHVTR